MIPRRTFAGTAKQFTKMRDAHTELLLCFLTVPNIQVMPNGTAETRETKEITVLRCETFVFLSQYDPRP